MKRMYFILDGEFPRNGAITNYIQYLALCAQGAGFATIVLSQRNDEFVTKENPVYKNIIIKEISLSKDRFIQRIQLKSGFVYRRIRVLKDDLIGRQDVVVAVSRNEYFLKALLRLRKKKRFKIVGTVLELFAREDFDGDQGESRYLAYKKILDNYITQYDLVLPISTLIQDYFREKGCKTFLLPIMADNGEYRIKEKRFDKCRMIIPAMGKMKDALSIMIMSYMALDQKERDRTELHLCGIKKEQVAQILSEEELRMFSKSAVFHKWMKYDELVELYQSMNFLLLARDDCQMTRANFPSKVPEVMTYGVVPIVSDIGDYTRYYLEDNVNSLFFPNLDVETCAGVLRSAIDMDHEVYMSLSKAARKCVEERFDYRNWVIPFGEAIAEIQLGEQE